jgi:hypothetical protein
MSPAESYERASWRFKYHQRLGQATMNTLILVVEKDSAPGMPVKGVYNKCYVDAMGQSRG